MKREELTSAMRSSLQFDLDVARAVSHRYKKEIAERLKRLPNHNPTDELVPIFRLFLQLDAARAKALSAELGLVKLS
jgi:hypothetical protein